MTNHVQPPPSGGPTTDTKHLKRYKKCINIEKICRACLLEAEEMIYIFEAEFESNLTSDSSKIIKEMMMACCSIEVMERDNLPQKLCSLCHEYLTKAYSFRELCRKSDTTLKNWLKRVKVRFESTTDEFSNNFCSDLQQSVDSQSLKIDTNKLEDTGQKCNDFTELTPVNVLNSDSNDASIGNILLASQQDSCQDQLEIYPVLSPVTGAAKTDKIQLSDLRDETRTEPVKEENEDETELSLFPCEHCVECFTNEEDLQVHRKKFHFICSICNQIFSSQSTLCRHQKNHEENKRHLCMQCGKKFHRSDDLKRHLRVHSGEKPFVCKLCGASFAQSFRLLEHKRAHLDEKNFMCAICSKRFARLTGYLAHKKIHELKKQFRCEVCGKGVSSQLSLTCHMKTHTGLKDHYCPYCGKGFTNSSNLVIHKRLHTGEKPYKCQQCEKAFPDQSRLKVHIRSHTGEKPYVCSECNRGCVSSSQLKRHMRIHTGETPYQCILCPKAFIRSEDLKVHVKVHSGDKSHICQVCDKGFYQESTLKVHLRIHTGEKPYVCHICNRAFSQRGPLVSHMKLHVK